MEEELSQLKKALISLVVSSPTTMTVSRLMKDYRNMIGGVLPLAKFGYRECVPFLRERCTDIFVIEGTSFDPILTPKVTKNLAHIDQMVQKQKVQTGKHMGKRRSVQSNAPVESRHGFHQPIRPNSTGLNQPNRPNPTNGLNQPNRPSPTNGLNQPNRPTPTNGLNQPNQPNLTNGLNQPNRPNPTNEYNQPNRRNTYETTDRYENPPVVRKTENITQSRADLSNLIPPTITDMRKESDNYKHNEKNNKINHNDYVSNSTLSYGKENNDSNSVGEYEPSSPLSKFYKKRLPHYNSDMDFPSCDVSTSKCSTESGDQSSNSSSSKRAQLEELKAEIVALIADSADGVWCTDLIRLYKERYDRELRFSRFGHTSLISLVYSMEERVAISRPVPDADWLLQDPHRARAQPPVPRAPRPPRAPRAPLPDPGDALPGVEFEPDVFPADCLHYMECIPAPELADFCAGAQLEVIVGEVYSPSHFWMLRLGERHSDAMENIMDEMTTYYNSPEGAARALSRGAVRVGHYCAALFEADWHRALIVCIIDSDTVKVRHVDYGTVCSVPVAQLKPLRRAWAALPAQGLRARLAACRPAGAGWRWPRAACAHFLHRVQQRRLYAHVLQRDPQEDIVETFLIDTSGAEDVCLTRDLIRVGHADVRTDSALRSEDCYLYPRFEALESGATPNYADICRILADGIALQYVDEYRRHVPGPWAPPPPSQPPPPPAAAPDQPYPLELLNRVPLLQLEERAPPPRPPQPPLPPPPPQPPLEVRLTEAEWAVLSHLRGTDAAAAQCYLLTSALRKLTAPPPGFERLTDC